MKWKLIVALIVTLWGGVLISQFSLLIYYRGELDYSRVKPFYTIVRPLHTILYRSAHEFRTFSNISQLSDEITVVSAYWDLGNFRKIFSLRNCKAYKDWASIFQLILNPLVMYTDSREFYDAVRYLRNDTKYSTRIFLVDRNSSWAFQREDRIKEIYSIPGYPKYFPYTVLSAYPCAQHAKYDVMKNAAVHNYHRTKYFAWLDVGYFRRRISKTMFHLVKPEGFDESTIAMGEVFLRNENVSVQNIFLDKMVWVCGCLFLGRYDVIILHADEYKRTVDHFISLGLMNTDEQVLYGMYSQEGMETIKPKTSIQAYRGLDSLKYLGYEMIREVSPYPNYPKYRY